jgi:hypothetical protein
MAASERMARAFGVRRGCAALDLSCGWRLVKSVCFLWIKVFPFYRHSLRRTRQVKMRPLMVPKGVPGSRENRGEFLQVLMEVIAPQVYVKEGDGANGPDTT